MLSVFMTAARVCSREILPALSLMRSIIIVIIIRVCLYSRQSNPSLDRSHGCLCLANLDHTGPNYLDDSVFWSNLLGSTLLFWWSNGYKISDIAIRIP